MGFLKAPDVHTTSIAHGLILKNTPQKKKEGQISSLYLHQKCSLNFYTYGVCKHYLLPDAFIQYFPLYSLLD